MYKMLMNLGQNATIVYNLTTNEMFCSNKFVVSVKNLFIHIENKKVLLRT